MLFGSSYYEAHVREKRQHAEDAAAAPRLRAENTRLRETLKAVASFAGHADKIPHTLGVMAAEALASRDSQAQGEEHA
jgi:hypothetical protein